MDPRKHCERARTLRFLSAQAPPIPSGLQLGPAGRSALLVSLAARPIAMDHPHLEWPLLESLFFVFDPSGLIPRRFHGIARRSLASCKGVRAYRACADTSTMMPRSHVSALAGTAHYRDRASVNPRPLRMRPIFGCWRLQAHAIVFGVDRLTDCEVQTPVSKARPRRPCIDLPVHTASHDRVGRETLLAPARRPGMRLMAGSSIRPAVENARVHTHHDSQNANTAVPSG